MRLSMMAGSLALAGALVASGCAGGTARQTRPTSGSSTTASVLPAEEDGPTARRLLASDELAPGLTVSVWLAPLPYRPGARVWIYQSTGFSSVGRDEVALTVKVPDGVDAEAFPAEPASIFPPLLEAAREGKDLTPWVLVGFPGSIPGRPDMVGFMILPGDQNARAAGAGQIDVIVPITEQELRVAKYAGAARIANLLGQSHRFFPFPYWVDTTRKSVVAEGEASLLSRIPHSFVASMSAVAIRVPQNATTDISADTGLAETRGPLALQVIELRLDPASGTVLAENIDAAPSGTTWGFLCPPDPSAQGRLTWNAATEQVRGITDSPDGHAASVAGNFVVFAFTTAGEPASAVIMEDGFAVMIPESRRAALATALRTGADFDLVSADSAPSVRLVWRK